MRIVLAPDLRMRRYDEIADQVSLNARHLLWFLLEAAKEGAVQPVKFRARIRRSGHDWTEEQLASYLQELAVVHCVTFRE
jgi:hypothetical protein